MGAPAGNPRRRSRDTQGLENTFLGIRKRDRNRTGWRAVLDPGVWIRSLLVTAVFVVSLSALACAVGLARYTTGHDRHATYKLYWAEILLALNFDPRAPVAYRTSEGEETTLPRGELIFSGDALVARSHLVRTVKLSAELGAWYGLGAALMCLVLLGLQRAAHEGRPESPALPRRRPGLDTSTQAAKTPVRTPAERPPGPDAPPPLKPKLAGKGRRNEAAAPERRERDYGRWI